MAYQVNEVVVYGSSGVFRVEDITVKKIGGQEMEYYVLKPIYEHGGDTICVMDQVKDTENTDDSWIRQISLKEAIRRLPERERNILALRFYEGKTQMEVSAEIGISQAQVSRLEKTALGVIRKNL